MALRIPGVSACQTPETPRIATNPWISPAHFLVMTTLGLKHIIKLEYWASQWRILLSNQSATYLISINKKKHHLDSQSWGTSGPLFIWSTSWAILKRGRDNEDDYPVALLATLSSPHAKPGLERTRNQRITLFLFHMISGSRELLSRFYSRYNKHSVGT